MPLGADNTFDPSGADEVCAFLQTPLIAHEKLLCETSNIEEPYQKVA